MELDFRRTFLKDIKQIREPATLKKIEAAISDARQAATLLDLKNVKKLEGSPAYYRIRIGEYRIGVKLQEHTLIFMRCLHRKDIYRYFP